MNKRILLIDDEPDVLSGYKRNLNNIFEVTTAPDSTEAVNIINTSREFAVIITDYKMPGMNGIALLSIIKKLTPDSIRVLITGHPDTDVAIDAVNEGNIFRFLTKPYPPSRLIRVINECIEEYNIKKTENASRNINK
ncbi:MAG: response regulator [Bacteroidetes bacterium]|nr:MAG: response regulator [Bacteroidota bacterium]